MLGPDRRPITALGHALLCEIRRAPKSGYALRRLFETTPLGVFSSSPGSIYPALAKLGAQGLVTTTGSGRGRRFEITPSGSDLVERWLAVPVTVAEVARRPELCMLRFAFLEGHPDPGIAGRYLASLEQAATSREAELTDFLAGAEGLALSRHGRLAVEQGIGSIRGMGRWAADARARLAI